LTRRLGDTFRYLPSQDPTLMYSLDRKYMYQLEEFLGASSTIVGNEKSHEWREYSNQEAQFAKRI